MFTSMLGPHARESAPLDPTMRKAHVVSDQGHEAGLRLCVMVLGATSKVLPLSALCLCTILACLGPQLPPPCDPDCVTATRLTTAHLRCCGVAEMSHRHVHSWAQGHKHGVHFSLHAAWLQVQPKLGGNWSRFFQCNQTCTQEYSCVGGRGRAGGQGNACLAERIEPQIGAGVFLKVPTWAHAFWQ